MALFRDSWAVVRRSKASGCPDNKSTCHAEPRRTDPEELASALMFAGLGRRNLVIQWRDVSKPKRQGAVAAQRTGSRKDFAICFEEWLRARGLQDFLREDGYKQGWKVYKYIRKPVVESEEDWEPAFHGTWWYSVRLVLEAGVLLDSNDGDKGHDFWEPGVYCTPVLETARWYARPQILFADGVYHRIVYELRVNTSKRLRNRQRGGVQWVFKPDSVSLYGIWVQRNQPPAVGEERINSWDPKLEARPLGSKEVDATRNRRHLGRPVHQPFSDTEDEPGRGVFRSAFQRARGCRDGAGTSGGLRIGLRQRLETCKTWASEFCS